MYNIASMYNILGAPDRLCQSEHYSYFCAPKQVKMFFLNTLTNFPFSKLRILFLCQMNPSFGCFSLKDEFKKLLFQSRGGVMSICPTIRKPEFCWIFSFLLQIFKVLSTCVWFITNLCRLKVDVDAALYDIGIKTG